MRKKTYLTPRRSSGANDTPEPASTVSMTTGNLISSSHNL